VRHTSRHGSRSCDRVSFDGRPGARLSRPLSAAGRGRMFPPLQALNQCRTRFRASPESHGARQLVAVTPFPACSTRSGRPAAMTAVSRRILAFEPRTDLSGLVDLRWSRDRMLERTPAEGEVTVNPGFHLSNRVEDRLIRLIQYNLDI